MEPIDMQPASTLCPYGYMWLCRGQRGGDSNAGAEGGEERAGGEAVIDIHPNDPDVIDVKQMKGNSVCACVI